MRNNTQAKVIWTKEVQFRYSYGKWPLQVSMIAIHNRLEESWLHKLSISRALATMKHAWTAREENTTKGNLPFPLPLLFSFLNALLYRPITRFLDCVNSSSWIGSFPCRLLLHLLARSLSRTVSPCTMIAFPPHVLIIGGILDVFTVGVRHGCRDGWGFERQRWE